MKQSNSKPIKVKGWAVFCINRCEKAPHFLEFTADEKVKELWEENLKTWHNANNQKIIPVQIKPL